MRIRCYFFVAFIFLVGAASVPDVSAGHHGLRIAGVGQNGVAIRIKLDMAGFHMPYLVCVFLIVRSDENLRKRRC